MVKAAHSEQLQRLFEVHLAETEAQAERLSECLRLLEAPARAKVCKGMAGLIEEGEEVDVLRKVVMAQPNRSAFSTSSESRQSRARKGNPEVNRRTTCERAISASQQRYVAGLRSANQTIIRN